MDGSGANLQAEVKLMLEIIAAVPLDLEALTETSRQAFDHDVNYGAPEPGGPPGYESVEFHRRALAWGRVFKLVEDGKIVGGCIVSKGGPGHFAMQRIWLVPSAQGRGLGEAVMRWLEAEFPEASRWTLDTPEWNARTQRFYEKLGYRRVPSKEPGMVYYERRRSPQQED